MIIQQLSLFQSVDFDTTPESKPSDENYTPEDVMDLVHRFYGFPSLDPFSCEEGNRFVKASKFFTKQDNGLAQDWRNYPTIWMNPPYSRGFLEPVVDKLIELLKVSQPEVFLLTNTDHSTGWYKKAVKKCDRFALSHVRLSFYSPSRAVEGKKNDSNNRPQTLFYFGSQPQKFKQIFKEFGVVCRTDE